LNSEWLREGGFVGGGGGWGRTSRVEHEAQTRGEETLYQSVREQLGRLRRDVVVFGTASEIQ